MPHAHGSDRLEALVGGRYRIVSPRPKGWRASRPATRTRAEFPGTTVAWDGTLWEVISSDEHPRESSEYVLAPWKEHHAIRLSVDYDDASEAAIEAASRRAATRRRMSAGIFAAGLVTGLLPAPVQKQVESEYGISSTRLTLVSLVTQLTVAAIGFAGMPIEGLAGPKWPVSVFLLAWLALIEAVIRGWYTLSRGLPLGSIEGLLLWWLLCAVSSRARGFDRAARREVERQTSTASVRPPGDFELERDAYVLREPFLALLQPGAQIRLAETFGFDPYVWGIRSATTLAIISGAGVASALLKIFGRTSNLDTWISLTLASLLLAEQVKRFVELRRGRPAGSVLGAFVSPFCTALLATAPRALEKGSTNRLERPLPEVWDGDGADPGDDQIGR